MPRIHRTKLYLRVYFSARDVEAFARRWPCFGTPGRAWFDLDTRNGDLLDLWMDGYMHDVETGDSTHDEAGIAALSRNATNYAIDRGFLPAQPRR